MRQSIVQLFGDITFLERQALKMANICSRAVGVGVASLLLIGAAFARSTAPAPVPTTKTAPTAKPPVEHSAASIECSKQADAKGLHGKERKKFRSECKKNAVPK